MDEEFNDDSSQNRRNSRARRSSIISLDHQSMRSRSASLNRKHSLLEVMSIQGNDMSEDIFHVHEFEARRRSMVRNSNASRFESNNESSMESEEASRGYRRSSNNKGLKHDCQCDGDCLEYHCPCYSEYNEMCLVGSCCRNCIQMKNAHMLASIPTHHGCTCKNGKCSKQTCQCFNNGQSCNPRYCKCKGCENINQNYQNEKPKNSKKQLKGNKNNGNKNVKFVGISCSCKKSHCLKKYCCCYASGKECGPQCVCEQCHNQYEEHEDKEEKDEERKRYAKVDEDEEEDIEKYFQEDDYDDLDMPMSMEFEHPDMKLSYQH